MNKKTISMLALGLLLGSGLIGVRQTLAQNSYIAKKSVVVRQQEAKKPSYKDSVEINETKHEGKNEQKMERADNEKEGVKKEKAGVKDEKDGINHQFNGQEEHTD